MILKFKSKFWENSGGSRMFTIPKVIGQMMDKDIEYDITIEFQDEKKTETLKKQKSGSAI